MKEIINHQVMNPIYDVRDLEKALSEQDANIIYFSNDSCNVCKVLKPKVIEMAEDRFPRLNRIYIDTEKSPLIAGQYRVFTIPTILIYFQDKEHTRFSRSINMYELEQSISRPYALIFGEEC